MSRTLGALSCPDPLKIEDGALRAADVAVASLLQRLGCFGGAEDCVLARFLQPVVNNVAGRPVGTMRATGALRLAMEQLDSGWPVRGAPLGGASR